MSSQYPDIPDKYSVECADIFKCVDLLNKSRIDKYVFKHCIRSKEMCEKIIKKYNQNSSKT